jgi:xanthine/CO dehydrogenase XdhC/CoxF family maturation factor
VRSAADLAAVQAELNALWGAKTSSQALPWADVSIFVDGAAWSSALGGGCVEGDFVVSAAPVLQEGMVRR